MMIDKAMQLLTIRESFPSWRQFTESQVHKIKEFASSNFNIDRTSYFNIRPTELIFVMEVEIYLRYFIVQPGYYKLNENLLE